MKNTTNDAAVNWEECLELTNFNESAAKEILAIFLQELPSMRHTITQAFQNQDYETMQAEIHKLHGGCCYCGVPNLKAIVVKIEKQLKAKEVNQLAENVKAMNDEIERVIIFLQNFL